MSNSKLEKPISNKKASKEAKILLIKGSSPRRMQAAKHILFRFLKSLPSLGRGQRHEVIPFDWSSFKKGGQYPTIRLYVTTVPINLASATNYSTVFNLTFAGLLNNSDLAAVFSEYRVIRGMLELYPSVTQPVSGSIDPSNVAIAVIDYIDTSALASFDGGVAYDTKKFFSTNMTQTQLAMKPVRWPLEFEPLPDQEWVDTSSSVVFCSWKPFIAHSIASTPTVGLLTGWVDVQFRGTQ